MEELNFDEDTIRKWVEPYPIFLSFFLFFYDDDEIQKVVWGREGALKAGDNHPH